MQIEEQIEDQIELMKKNVYLRDEYINRLCNLIYFINTPDKYLVTLKLKTGIQIILNRSIVFTNNYDLPMATLLVNVNVDDSLKEKKDSINNMNLLILSDPTLSSIKIFSMKNNVNIDNLIIEKKYSEKNNKLRDISILDI
jgi:hypothetical protein